VSLNRRDVIRTVAATILTGNPKRFAASTAPIPGSSPWTHGIALLGELKYSDTFKYFDYVNPNAPQGGAVRQAVLGTYDSFNLVVASLKGNLVIYDTLMVSSRDEVASEYGLIAEAARYPADFSWVSFRLRPAARWHDGKPISPEDVIFSLETSKKLDPGLAVYYRHVIHADSDGDHGVRFQFDAPGIRELPQIMGQLTVLPRHWWEAKNKAGKPRDISETALEPPLGSGAYRAKSFEAGRSITYECVADYWARSLPVNIGANNFRELRFDYFRDSSIAFEALKAGSVDWRIEDAAKNCATGYGFPAIAEKRVALEEFPIRNIGIMQAFAFNSRRLTFQDPSVRQAFNFAFDFEKINQELFYGQYKRISSYFEGTELASSGLPKGWELEFLQAVRAELLPEIFTTPYSNPISGSYAAFRANLLKAMQLLSAAGFKVKDLVLIEPKSGERMSVELLISNESFERVVGFYQPALERLGVAGLGFRHHRRYVGGNADAWQRAVGLLGLALGRSAGIPQPYWDQEPGRGRPDQAHGLCRQPRRPGCRDQGAGSCSIVQPLRRAAMEFQRGAHGPLGRFRPPPAHAKIWPDGLSNALVASPTGAVKFAVRG
jgi:microcin C transport system substrate-binding protein